MVDLLVVIHNVEGLLHVIFPHVVLDVFTVYLECCNLTSWKLVDLLLCYLSDFVGVVCKLEYFLGVSARFTEVDLVIVTSH